MEEVEHTFVVGAIGWLVQTILESLFSGKLEAWIRGAGLADDIEKLRSEIERVEMVVAAVKGRAIGNKPLARSLARLKERLYDADDAVDELDYYRLQQQVQLQGVAWHDTDDTDGHGAGQVERPRGNADIPSSSRGKKRANVWENFKITEEVSRRSGKAECIHCHTVVKCGSDKGTSVLHNHLKSDGCKKKRGASDQQPNTSSTAEVTTNGNSVSRKRMRMDESTYNTAANTPSWNKAECSSRVQQITRQLQDIRVAVGEVLNLHRSDSVASPCNHQSTTPDPCLRTSNLVQRKVYGRCAEKDSIIKLMKADKSDSVTVLPIVGIGGIGKTALAQFAYNYNDPGVENLFDHRIWVSVSKDFDEVKLVREMLDFVSQEMHAGISSFAKLQEMLKRCMELKRSLLILDDVWNDMDDYRWNNLLAPLKSDNAKGNVILVTTRNLSVAKKIGTVEPIKLADLENKDFWLLFKACAFNDENYEGHPSLNIIGQQIAEKLQGNPLAAETAGVLLRKHLTIDHWSNIQKNQDWKSLQLSRGIMPALKLSYDQLPYHLQQCFSYCCIFPKNYQFVTEEVIRIWIAQGFVNGDHSSKRLEEIGQDYLFDLVNSGFFQQTKREVPSLGNQTCYVMCGLMHDLGMAVSRTECATIDGLQCNEMLPTVHHLSIVTDSAYSKDQHANILRNEAFEKKLLNVVTSVRRLRTLVLIGQYDTSFFQLFQNLFKEAQNLRVLQISGNCADFNSFMCNVANPTHLRYLNLDAGEEDVSLPQVLSKFCHLQVLAASSKTYFTRSNGFNNLVSLRHLVAEEGACSSIVSIGKMTSLQELDNFRVRNSRGFEIKQLQSMNELVQLRVSQLQNVKTREEAYEAGLTNKQHLEKLHLSWYGAYLQDEYDSDIASEPSRDTATEEESSPMDDQDEYDSDIASEPSRDTATEEESSPMDDSGPSSEPSRDTAREMLEGLEPHHNLKHLQISGYDGATSPEWLATSLTSLQTLHLECCGKWRILPSLERLLFLRKLELRNMGNVTEVLLPSLEELVLDEMPKLERCSCTSERDLNSSLRVLDIKRCPSLKVFPLFESSQKFKMSAYPNDELIWSAPEGLLRIPLNVISSLKKITICACPDLTFYGSKDGFAGFTSLVELNILGCPKLLPSSVHKDGNDEQANGRRLLPQSLAELKIIGDCPETLLPYFPENLTCLKKLEVGGSPSLKSLQLHSYTSLEELVIAGSGSFISLEGLQFLGSLRLLRVSKCLGDHEQDGRWLLPQSLGELQIEGKSPKTLMPCFPENLTRLKILQVQENPGLKSLQLHSCTALEELTIESCGSLDSIEGLQSLGALRHFEVFQCPGLKSLQLHSCTAPEKLTIVSCGSLDSIDLQSLGTLRHLKVFECGGLKSLQLHSCTALEELAIKSCGSLDSIDLQSLGALRHLEVFECHGLKSLQLHSCTALEKLAIESCGSLDLIEGLQSLGALGHLKVLQCPGLPPCLCPRLETLEIDDLSALTLSFCKHLTSLQLLRYCLGKGTRLTDEQEREQERALQLLASLKELQFRDSYDLVDLPAGLHRLRSLKRLKIDNCKLISRLPEKGLPPSLEELEISYCSEELTDQCRKLATSKLKVKIDGEYVN